MSFFYCAGNGMTTVIINSRTSMFPIFTQKTSKPGLTIQIDGNCPIAVPPHISLSVGDRQDRYSKWLEEALRSNPNVTSFLAKMYEAGKTKGGLILINKSKAYPYQAGCLRSFFVKHEETLEVMIPYLRQGMTAERKLIGDLPEEDQANLRTGNMTLGDLPPDDRDQIMALLQKAQAQETPAIPSAI